MSCSTCNVDRIYRLLSLYIPCMYCSKHHNYNLKKRYFVVHALRGLSIYCPGTLQEAHVHVGSHSGMLRLATPMYLCYNVYDTFSTYV